MIMMVFMAPRLRKPVIRGLAGTLLAAAFLVRGGHTWWFSVLIEVSSLGAAVGVYLQGREDNDEGALAGRVAGIAALLGLVITTATRSPWSSWRPFAVLLAVTALGYLFGLSAYGSSDSGAADEQAAGHPATSPGTR
jgi:hypothetical protein